MRYNCHINVEVCASPKAAKYLLGYVHKGTDRAVVQTEYEDDPIDEIARYEDLRCVGSSEAAWHLLNFPITGRYPAVHALRVHLKDQQQVVFDADTEEEALETQRYTELTAFFSYNHQQVGNGVAPIQLPRYVEMPKTHVYDRKKKEWRLRKRADVVIGRVHSVNPISGEVYYLRMLLQDDHCRGKVSFEDMLTIDTGRQCETFKEVCVELGLLNDDREWQRVLEEAAATKMCPTIRELYVIILIFCRPSEPLALFNEFWTTWTDDFERQGQRNGNLLSEGQLKTMVLLDIEMRLQSHERRLEHFGLPTPTDEELAQVERIVTVQSAVMREELDFDPEELQQSVNDRVPTFTDEQQLIYTKIMNAVQNNIPFQAFIDACGGCGKTYLLNTILAAVRSKDGGCTALAMATTGIAANLLDMGRTFHSRMKAPLTVSENSTLGITGQSNLAELIRETKLMLIDEATMLDRYMLEALDRTLRDLMEKPDRPFGDKVVILAGDFRQCLPVVPGANRPGTVKHCINQSNLWKCFSIMTLTKNMRVLASGDKKLEDFAKWTLSVGNGDVKEIQVPISMILTKISANSKANPTSEGKAMVEFCKKMFPDLEVNINDREWIEGRTILAATNKEVTMLNETVSDLIPGNAAIFKSADELENPSDLIRFNTEYLNSLQPNGFPPHKLMLKPGMPLMLLRNLCPRQGLCNGTKLVYVQALNNKLLECKMIASDRTVLIPRIVFNPKVGEYPFEWRRRQYPVKPAFATTINKSQGK